MMRRKGFVSVGLSDRPGPLARWFCVIYALNEDKFKRFLRQKIPRQLAPPRNNAKADQP